MSSIISEIKEFKYNLINRPTEIERNDIKKLIIMVYHYKLKGDDLFLRSYEEKLAKIEELAKKQLPKSRNIDANLKEHFIQFIQNKRQDIIRKEKEAIAYKELIGECSSNNNSLLSPPQAPVLLKEEQAKMINRMDTVTASLITTRTNEKTAENLPFLENKESFSSESSNISKSQKFIKFVNEFENLLNDFKNKDGIDVYIKKSIFKLIENEIRSFTEYTSEERNTLKILFQKWSLLLQNRIAHKLPEHQEDFQKSIRLLREISEVISESKKGEKIALNLAIASKSNALTVFVSSDERVARIKAILEDFNRNRGSSALIEEALAQKNQLMDFEAQIDSFFLLFKLLVKINAMTTSDQALFLPSRGESSYSISLKLAEEVDNLHQEIEGMVGDIRDHFVEKLPTHLTPEELIEYQRVFEYAITVENRVIKPRQIKSSKPTFVDKFSVPDDLVSGLTNPPTPTLTNGSENSLPESSQYSSEPALVTPPNNKLVPSQLGKGSNQLALRTYKEHHNRYISYKGEQTPNNDFKEKTEELKTHLKSLERKRVGEYKKILKDILICASGINFETYTYQQMTAIERDIEKLAPYISKAEGASVPSGTLQLLFNDLISEIKISAKSYANTGTLVNPEFIDIYRSRIEDYTELFEPMLGRLKELKLCEHTLLYHVAHELDNFLSYLPPLDKFDLGYFINAIKSELQEIKKPNLIQIKILKIINKICSKYYSEEGSFAESNPMPYRALQADMKQLTNSSHLPKEFNSLVLLSEEEKKLPVEEHQRLTLNRKEKLYNDFVPFLERYNAGEKKALRFMLSHLHPDSFQKKPSIEWAVDNGYGTLSFEEKTIITAYMTAQMK